MKTMINRSGIMLIAFTIMAFASCKDADYDTIGNAVYFSNADGLSKSENIVVDAGGTSVSLRIRTSQPVDNDVKVTITVDGDYISEYNKRYSTDFQPLPEGFYAISEKTTTIPAGEVMGTPIDIKLEELSAEMAQTGFVYALAVRIETVDGEVSVLDNSATYVYAIRAVPYYNVPTFQKGNSLLLNFANPIELSQFTVEYLVKVSSFGSGAIGNYNNQILFNARNVGENDPGKGIFMRFGDTSIPGNIFQLKTMDTKFDGQTSFTAGKWFHIAAVNDGQNIILYIDGKEDSRVASPGKVLNLRVDGARFCGEKNNDSYMKSLVTASQLRIWSVARTGDQIRNTMYGVTPTTPGLEAYWRLNEGSGSVFEDATGHGHTAQAEEFNQATIWTANERVEIGR